MSGVSKGIDKVGEVLVVNEEANRLHERFLFRRLALTKGNENLLQGPLTSYPSNSINIPNFTSTKVVDQDGTAYVMTQTDFAGEKKVERSGALNGGRQYLCDHFIIYKKNHHRFILIKDLLQTLQYSGSIESFCQQFDNLYAILPDEDELTFLKNHGLVENESIRENCPYVNAKSAFVQFGASIIQSGTRCVDDYWESVAEKQGLISYHRVFKFSNNFVNKFYKIHPLKQDEIASSDSASRINQVSNIESPYLSVSEETSSNVRKTYLTHYSKGEATMRFIPGQNITGSLEISTLYKVPKYHNRFSFLQAAQANAMDTPIYNPIQQQKDQNFEKSEADSTGNTTPLIHAQTPPLQQAKKPVSRMVSCLLDTSSNGKTEKRGSKDELLDMFDDDDDSLTINGWKFGNLPLIQKHSQDYLESQFSHRGLPYFDKKKLKPRLKLLTPNQIKELEHMHDSVSVSTGLQAARDVRRKKWKKYWQHKAGVPVGLIEYQEKYFANQYIKDLLSKATVDSEYDEINNCDRVHTTIKIPNANFLGHVNISEVPPPYASRIEK